MTKNQYKTIYPFNVVSDEVFNLLTASEHLQITKNEQVLLDFYQKNVLKSHHFTVESKDTLIAYTQIALFRNRSKVIYIYHHNFQKNIHSPELLKELIRRIRDFYRSENWIGIYLNLPVGFLPEKLDEKLAHVHCRYFVGRAAYFPIQLPDNYKLRIPIMSFDLVDTFEEMNRKFKQKNPNAEIWEDTLWFEYWLRAGKSVVIYDAKNHPVAGIFMTHMKAFVFRYPTWQIQFVITDSAHRRKGLAGILRKFASNLALAQNPSALIGGIVGLWNVPSIKYFDINGRVPCLDRILIDRDERIGYQRAWLSGS